MRNTIVRYEELEDSYQFQFIGKVNTIKDIIEKYDILREPNVITVSLDENGDGAAYVGPDGMGKHVEPTHLYNFIDAYDVIGIIFWIHDSDKAMQIKLQYVTHSETGNKS